MKTPLSRALALLVAGVGLSLGTGCISAPGQESSHWNLESVGPRVMYHMTGYREDLSGSFREHQWQQKQDLNLTMRRHFLNNNPENPFQADDPGIVAPRPPHSIAPDPVDYFHLEAVAVGLGFLALSNVFIPIPINSVLGTLEEGGAEEFRAGLRATLSGSFGAELGEPAPVEQFRVRNVGY